MATWALLGGPQHGDTGDGAVPARYVFVAAGNQMPMGVESRYRDADEVFRWDEDAEYIRDGFRILDNFTSGNYATAPEHAQFAAMMASFGFGALRAGLGIIADDPESEDAQAWRDTIDGYRKNGLV